MTKRRVLVDARLPWGSGIGRYVRNILPGVAARLPDVDFSLLVSPADVARAHDAELGGNVRIVASTIRPFSLAEQLQLPGLAARYDLTWFTNYWMPLRWKGRAVTTVHDLMHLDPRFPASNARRFAATQTFAKVRRDAAHVLFVSRFTAREFVARVGQPIASTVVHHGIDHQGMTRLVANVPRRRSALVVAASKEHKNLSLLLDAWALAAVPEWELTIVMPDDDLRSSVNIADQAARIREVRILRGISDDALGALYADTGLVMVPSRYEGFGLPLLEAMRAGAPVISSTAEALVEVASGALIPMVSPADLHGWAEAIRVATTPRNAATEAAIIERNRAVAWAFTWDRAANQTADLLSAELAQT